MVGFGLHRLEVGENWGFLPANLACSERSVVERHRLVEWTQRRTGGTEGGDISYAGRGELQNRSA